MTFAAIFSMFVLVAIGFALGYAACHFRQYREDRAPHVPVTVVQASDNLHCEVNNLKREISNTKQSQDAMRELVERMQRVIPK